MSNPKPLDPLTAELLALVRLLINRLAPADVADVANRLAALEQWRADSAGVYPTINGGQS